MNLQAVLEAAARDRNQKAIFERLYQDTLNTPLPADPAALGSSPNTAAATAAMPLAQQLQLARTNLAALEARLREDHPDVRRARDMVAELTKKVQAETAPAAPVDPAPRR